MKVPIRYKSSDRYNAGVDVVYDDESKLQYAPFVYATTASGDSGGDGEEEGEDSMVVNIIVGENELSLDKTWQEIYDAIANGKCVYLREAVEDAVSGMSGYALQPIDYVGSGNSDTITYIVATHTLTSDEGVVSLGDMAFVATSATGTPTLSQS